ncbi:MAG: hypothetical protein QXI19_09215 [Candidatus Caldarchaeum sp.]
MSDKVPEMDDGDKIGVHISFKKGLPNYSSVEFGASVTVTKRNGESPEEAWERAWRIVEREVDNAVERAEAVMNQQ